MKRRITTKNIILVLAWSSVALGVLYSLNKNPEILSNLDWSQIILVIAILTPMTMACNALGFMQSANLVNQNQGFIPALQITTTGTLANQLPIPAAFIMRVNALRSAGAGILESIHATITISIIWVGCALLISAIAAYALGAHPVFFMLFGLGMAACLYGSFRFRGRVRAHLMPVVAVGIIISLLDTLRLYVSFKAIGFSPGITECFLLTAASAVSNIVTFIPGGIGIREYSAAGLSTFTNIPPAYALLATTVNRLTGLIGAACLLFILFLRKSGK